MTKSALRHYYKKRRQTFVEEHEGHDFEADFLARFQEHVVPLLTKDTIIALYDPLPFEASPRLIFEWLLAKGYKVAFPKMKDDRICFVLVNKDTVFAPSAYAFNEPLSEAVVEPSLVMAPLLAFDRQGHRLGYGKGHYDGALTMLRSQKKVLMIGVAYPCQHIELLPSEEHDQKLDAVLLPHAYIRFR